MQQGRWVSYIYRYRNGVRCENAGFIKVQRIAHRLRDDVRIQIGLRLYKKRACDCKVYLLHDTYRTEYLHEIHFAAEERDTIMSRIEVPWDNPLGDGMSIESYDGLFFLCDDGEMLTGMWNEYEVQLKAITDNMNKKVQGTEEEDAEHIRGEMRIHDAESMQGGMRIQEEERTQGEMRIQEAEYTRGEMHTQEEVHIQNTEHDSKNISEEQRQDAIQESVQGEEAVQQELEEVSATEQITESWQTILDTYPRLPLFTDSQLLECVKIVPQDIGKLAIGNWKLGVNTFVSHGYYHYRYLMLGRVKFDSGECVVIGVPGVFTNKEKYLANMFGFDTFVPAKKSNVLTGNFGYWVSEVRRE